MKTLPSVLTLLLTATLARAAAPVVSNIRASQRAGTKLVDIYYDVSDADGDALTVEIQVSNDNGNTYACPRSPSAGRWAAASRRARIGRRCGMRASIGTASIPRRRA